jgi:hypothetical protein
MNPLFESQVLATRRQFFGQNGLRLGGLALTWLMGQDRAQAVAAGGGPAHPALPGFPHFAL